MNTIFDYSARDIEQLVVSLGHKKFRAKQLIQWLYGHGVESYDEMKNLPGPLRESLKEAAPLIIPDVIDSQVSTDGTQKYLVRLHDGSLVETVAIPSRDEGTDGKPRRLTVCFSTQVGCPMQCSFCATGQEGFTRNLTPGEMVWQIILCQKLVGMRVSNVVAMGQGEPFLNYDNVIAALRFMNSPDALGIGARHITVSTCGITSGIHSLAHEPEQFTLAISLHSAEQEIRDALMPVSAAEPLTTLKEELAYYQRKTGRRITLEYLMIKDLTDTDEALKALKSFCESLSVHVNLLNINPIANSPYQPTPTARRISFQQSLESAHIETTTRNSRGSDITAACGQLKNARAIAN